MNCQLARDVFPELLDRRTAATAHLGARAHLAGCPDCQRWFAALTQTATALDTMIVPPPSAGLRRNFYAMLEEEKHYAASVRSIAERASVQQHGRLRWYVRWVASPLAGCALMALGFFAGARSTSMSVVVPVAGDATTQAKLAELQRKVDTMGQLVSYSLLQQQQRPTNDRLRGVLASAATDRPNAQIINELISALALDPSANVRLCALDGLSPHADQAVVRAGVLASLPREHNPLVQISMIDLLTTARDAGARPALERISLSDNTDSSVREAALRALAQL